MYLITQSTNMKMNTIKHENKHEREVNDVVFGNTNMPTMMGTSKY